MVDRGTVLLIVHAVNTRTAGLLDKPLASTAEWWAEALICSIRVVCHCATRALPAREWRALLGGQKHLWARHCTRRHSAATLLNDMLVSTRWLAMAPFSSTPMGPLDDRLASTVGWWAEAMSSSIQLSRTARHGTAGR